MVWLPTELDTVPVARRSFLVIDVIRATTSIATALAAGASRVITVGSVAAGRALAGGGGLLCGERGGRPPDGFDLGNSPGDFGPERVRGRTLIFTTTNGTAAVEAVRGGRGVRLACFRNAGAAAAWLVRAGSEGPVTIVCAGRNGRIGMDDAWCAGHLVDRVASARTGPTLGEGARVARAVARDLGTPTASALARTAAGRALRKIGLDGDLVLCAAVDDLDVVPVLREDAFVTGGEEDVDVG